MPVKVTKAPFAGSTKSRWKFLLVPEFSRTGLDRPIPQNDYVRTQIQLAIPNPDCQLQQRRCRKPLIPNPYSLSPDPIPYVPSP